MYLRPQKKNVILIQVPYLRFISNGIKRNNASNVEARHRFLAENDLFFWLQPIHKKIILGLKHPTILAHQIRFFSDTRTQINKSKVYPKVKRPHLIATKNKLQEKQIERRNLDILDIKIWCLIRVYKENPMAFFFSYNFFGELRDGRFETYRWWKALGLWGLSCGEWMTDLIEETTTQRTIPERVGSLKWTPFDVLVPKLRRGFCGGFRTWRNPTWQILKSASLCARFFGRQVNKLVKWNETGRWYGLG